MLELTRVDTWLAGLLLGDATLAALIGDRVYVDVAQQGAAFPFVILSFQAGHDVRGIGKARILVDALYQVKAIGQTESYVELGPIADRLDVLLEGATGSAGGGQVLTCLRQEPLHYAETDAGVSYRYLGALWRIQAQ